MLQENIVIYIKRLHSFSFAEWKGERMALCVTVETPSCPNPLFGYTNFFPHQNNSGITAQVWEGDISVKNKQHRDNKAKTH